MATKNPVGSLQNEHPLLNSLILDNIFDKEKWTVDELKNFRSVCSTWYDATLDVWSSSACIVLDGSKNETNKNISMHPNVGSDVFKRYLDHRNTFSLNSSLKYKTINKYKLFKCNVDERNKDMEMFWETVTPDMKQLTMQECVFRNPNTFQNIVYYQTPNVECLVLNSNTFTKVTDNCSGEVSDIDVFSDPEEETAESDEENVWDWEDNIHDGGSGSDADVEEGGSSLEGSDDSEVDGSLMSNVKSLEGFQSKLKCLKIDNEKILTGPVSFTYFLSHFPSLEDMTIKALQSDRYNYRACNHAYDWLLRPRTVQLRRLPNASMTGQLWNALNDCRRTDKTQFRIKKLDIMHLCQDAVYFYESPPRVMWGSIMTPADIADPKLPLELLSMDIGFSDRSYVKHVIQSHAETLQVLKLFRAPYTDHGLEGLPIDFNLVDLTEMHLFGDIAIDFCFLEWMPNLRVLMIERWCYTKRDKLSTLLVDAYKPPNNLNHLFVERSFMKRFNVCMEHLVEFDFDSAFNSQSIHVLAEWMPHLKIVRLVLTNETLQAVADAWPGLAELTVKFESDVDDEGIKKLVQLEHLRKFKLEAYCNASRLTNESADVFENMGMVLLNSLEICVSEQMSEESERQLKSKLRKVKIMRNYGERDHEYECCSRLEFHAATRVVFPAN